MSDCLVVDATSRPIGFCRWEEAVKLIYEGVADVLKEDAEKELHSPSTTIKMPRVICVRDYVARRTRESVALTRRNIAIRDNKQCQYCAKVLTYDEQTLDHIVPESKGGKATWENLVLCCQPCNRFKADFLLEEVGWKLLKQPTKPKAGLQYSFIDKIRPEWSEWSATV
jgi:5-methylcytosine-specific restriction endonuclease McrA